MGRRAWRRRRWVGRRWRRARRARWWRRGWRRRRRRRRRRRWTRRWWKRRRGRRGVLWRGRWRGAAPAAANVNVARGVLPHHRTAMLCAAATRAKRCERAHDGTVDRTQNAVSAVFAAVALVAVAVLGDWETHAIATHDDVALTARSGRSANPGTLICWIGRWLWWRRTRWRWCGRGWRRRG